MSFPVVPATLTFAPLHAESIAAVAALEARVSPEPWSAKLFAGELDMHASARNWILASTTAVPATSTLGSRADRSEWPGPKGQERCSALGSADKIASLSAKALSLAGFGGMMFVEQEGHVMNMATDPDRQGQGIATQILHRLTLDAIERGVTDLTLEVRVNNEPALALYRRFGFAPVGVRKQYYVDNVDALIMWVHDIDSHEYSELLTKAVSR